MGLTRITAQQISDSDFKQAVRVVTTANINLSGAPSTVDGVALAVNNRILVTGQATASQNGLYYVAIVGAGSDGTWTRTTDGDTTGEMTAGMTMVVTEGTAYADSEWLLTTNDPIVLGTTSLAFIQISATIYSGSSNVSVTNSGNVLISTAGTANVATVATTGVYVAGLVSATGNVNAANLYISTDAVITGNLTVNGTTTTINSTTITTNDKNITIANNQTTSAAVDGAGIDVGGGTPIATWRYSNATASWQSNVGLTPTANGSIALGGASNFWGTAYVTTVSATGNVAGAYILGNGSLLTGIAATYGNANVAAHLAALGSNSISTTGSVTADYFVGNGSQLTGIVSSYGNANVVANLAALGSNPISTTGNITSGYILGNGSQLTGINSNYGNANVAANLAVFGANPISTTGNITGGNVAITNLTSTGISVTGLVSASGNITSASNISGTYILGNGALLTGITAAYGNTNVAANLAAFGSNPVSTTGNITSGNILTGGLISAAGNITGTNLFGTVQTATQLNITGLGTLSSLTVSGNTTTGNLLTGGLISAAGNIIASNLFGTIQTGSQLNITQVGTLSNLVVTGNIAGGNISTAGSGYFGNGLSIVGNITATGNVNYQNVTNLVLGDPLIFIGANNTTNLVDLGIVGSANVSGIYQHTGLARDHNTNIWRLFANVAAEPTTEIDWANSVYAPFAAGAITSNATISASGNITTSGNVSGNYILGNGSQLTGIVSSYGNANVAAYLPTHTGNLTAGTLSASGNITTSGNVSGNYILGNGSQLTGIVATATLGGSNTYVQFNNNGSLGGAGSFTFNQTTNTLAVTNANIGNSLGFNSPAGGKIAFVSSNTTSNVNFIVPVASGTSKQVLGVVDQSTQQLGWKTVPTYYINIGLRSGGSYSAPPAPVLRAYPIRLRDSSIMNVATVQ